MNLAQLSPFLKTRPEPTQVVSKHWQEREAILTDKVNLFCWQRQADQLITNYLEEVVQHSLEPIRLQTELSDLDKSIHQMRSSWTFDTEVDADPFWQDVSILIRDFLILTKKSSGTVHLRIVSDNACAKFHTDGYSLRLFTTYFGRGTQWLPERATNRAGLGKSNEEIVRDFSEIRELKPYEVGILKGEIPGKRSTIKGIVHRSPQVEESEERRIILRIDV